jgi:hypothetical protein
MFDCDVTAAAKAGGVLLTRIDSVFIAACAGQRDVRHGKENQKSCQAEVKVPHCLLTIE